MADNGTLFDIFGNHFVILEKIKDLLLHYTSITTCASTDNVLDAWGGEFLSTLDTMLLTIRNLLLLVLGAFVVVFLCDGAVSGAIRIWNWWSPVMDRHEEGLDEVETGQDLASGFLQSPTHYEGDDPTENNLEK